MNEMQISIKRNIKEPNRNKLKSVTTEMKKNHQKGSTNYLIRQKKESANLNTEKLKLSRLRSKRKRRKVTRPKRPVVHHQDNEHMDCGSQIKRQESKRLFKELRAENFQN